MKNKEQMSCPVRDNGMTQHWLRKANLKNIYLKGYKLASEQANSKNSLFCSV